VLLLLLVMVVGTCSYMGYLANYCAEIEAEYIAWLRALVIVGAYVEKTGSWPASWRDLEKMEGLEEPGWPQNAEWIKQRIVVDFDADINDLSGQSFQEFSAIRPRRPNSLCESPYNREVYVGPLLEAVRHAVARGKRSSNACRTDVAPSPENEPNFP